MPGIAPASLPAWVTSTRPHQDDAVDAVIAAFDNGAEVVFLDGPTGTGKTLIAEMVRRRLNERALYICSDKSLQRQFLKDFPYAALLQGRSNYFTQYGDRVGRDAVTAEDCTATGPNTQCMWCDGYPDCPYQVAKNDARRSDIAVLNTAYFLTESNYVGMFGRAELVIVDEADTLESALMGFVEYSVPEWIGKRLALEYPIKAARKTTIAVWLDKAAGKARDYLLTDEGQALDEKMQRKMEGFSQESLRVLAEIQKDIDAAKAEDGDDAEDNGRWIRDYDTKTFSLKPVIVAPYGNRYLWRHGKRFLLMSATLISPDEMADSLGLSMDWETVIVPMTFPVENRPIVLAPVANVTFRAEDSDYADLCYAIERIVEENPGERVLVHTANYRLTARLADQLNLPGRRVVTYTNAAGRRDAEALFRATAGAVMLAPSMARGVDLKDDACRVVIIAKCPFPALGDKRVSARTRLPGGQLWYSVQTVREIVQMVGRGVRSETDWCKTYILDKQFTSNLWGKNKMLFPAHFRDAVDASADVRQYMRAFAARFAS